MSAILLITDIAAPPEVCFDLVLNVDVQRSLGSGMDAVAGVISGPLQHGDTVTWRARHFGIIWYMTSLITQVHRPHCFEDEMQSGPFASWHHRHDFLPTGGGTRMIDDIRFTAPFGLVGWTFDRVVLDRYMRRLLMQRNRDLKRLAEHQAVA